MALFRKTDTATASQHALFTYVACNWGHHAYLAPQASTAVMAFLSRTGNVETAGNATYETHWSFFVHSQGQRWYSQVYSSKSLHLAAYFGLEAAVETTLEKTYDVDVRDSYGTTPLIFAVMARHDHVVRLLLAHNASVDARNNNNVTALVVVAHGGHAVVLTTLLENHAAVDGLQEDGARQPLLWAVRRGHVGTLKALLASGANVFTKSTGKTALHEAATRGNCAAAKLLLDANADVDARNTMNETPLHLAAEAGREETVSLLLESGASSHCIAGFELSTALHYAADGGHVAVGRLLLESGAEMYIRSSEGRPLLHTAAKPGHMTFVELLLSQKVDVNEPDCGSGTALLRAIAAIIDPLEMVKRLLDAGTEVNLPDNSGRTPLHEAVLKRDDNTLKHLLVSGAYLESRDESGRTPLFSAPQRSDCLILDHLIQAGSDLGVLDNLGQSVLFAASQYSSSAALETLLTQGMDLHVQDTLGNNLLTVISWNEGRNSDEKLDFARFLITKGLDVNHRNNAGETALLLSTRSNAHDAVKTLLDNCAGVRFQDIYGNSVLHVAVLATSHEWRESPIVELLIQHGAAINLQNDEGDTPLMLACDCDGEHIPETLLRHDAETNLVDAYGRSALIRATKSRSIHLVQLLLCHGAYVQHQDVLGRSALFFAFEYPVPAIADILLDPGISLNEQDAFGDTALSLAKKLIKVFLRQHPGFYYEGYAVKDAEGEAGCDGVPDVSNDPGSVDEEDSPLGYLPEWSSDWIEQM